MKQTIYATFTDIENAERATGALLDFGVRAEDVSLVAHEQHAGRAKYYVEDMEPLPRNEDLSAKTGISTTTGEDAASGALTGSTIGLGLGVIVALASIFLPGVGLIAGGGALSLALSGLAGTTGAGAIAGGVLGFLKDQGVPEHVANVYAETYHEGGAILAVNVPGNVSRGEIESVLNKYNGLHVGEYSRATTH
jgi:hypothetical protein